MNFEQINQTRGEVEEEQEFRAKERNSYRTIWQKIFGRERTGEMDIAVEEALLMDAEIEKQLREGKAASTTEAVENIEKEGQFGLKGKERISKEEWARLRALQFAGALEKNDFRKASDILYRVELEKEIDTNTRLILKEAIAPLVIKKITELVQDRDGENFVRAFDEFNRLQLITAESLPAEALRSPEIQGAIKKHLISWMDYDPNVFAKRRDEWEKAGIIDAKAMNQLPEIQKLAKGKLINSMDYDPNVFAKRRDEWTKAGIIDAQEMNQLQEIQKLVKERLISTMKDEPHSFIGRRDQWAKAGIISIEEANQLPEIQKLVKERLISTMKDEPHSFVRRRDQWAKAGIITAEEANTWPEIIALRKK